MGKHSGRRSKLVAWRARMGALLLLIAIAACGRPAGVAPAELGFEATATSTTTVRVVFEADVDASAELAENYRIDGGDLEVVRVARTAANTVLLGTAPQEPGRSYRLDVSGVEPVGPGRLAAQQSSFSGGSERAPIVASAIALSSTEVLVTYASPPPGQPIGMAESAVEIGFYDIVREGGSVDDATPDLTIVDAAFAPVFRDGRAAVVLTTEPQEDVQYTLRVTNVTTKSGEKLIDPNENTASFRGIPSLDVTRPTVQSVTALSNTSVLVEFSEAMLGLDGPNAFAIIGPDAVALAITGVTVSASQALLTTEPQRDEDTTYELTVEGVTDRQGNALDPDPTVVQFSGVSRRGPIDGDVTPPRVANVGSISPVTVLVTFSEPVAGGMDSAENPGHFRINAQLAASGLSQQAVLLVVGATLRPDGTTVELTTMAQSDLEYVLEVVNVKDLAGNQIAPPERGVDPSVMRFTGTAVAGVPDDADGDGLSDAAEQKGWIVVVRSEDGSTSRSEVTSDPALSDTDEDGVGDLDELVNGTNPRSADTDGDGLSDDEELNLYYSDPTHRDSDGDGLRDGLEVNFFDTSPIDADTDGDQLDDAEEVEADNRNPRLADVPRIQIEVGDVALTLDERFTYTDAEGTTQSSTSATSTTLEQGSERTYATSDTQTMASSIESTVGVEATYSFPKDFGGSVSASLTAGSSQEYSSTVSQASSTSSNRAYNESFEKSRTFESSSEVVREIVDAAVRLPISVGSLSDVAFSVENIEVTALQQDPLDRARMIPIATLVPEVVANGGASPRYSIGPGGSKSNIVFANREVFPQTVEALMKDPRGLLFQIANYDLTDELGRNFAFTQQEIIDRTASITVDYGDGRVASYQLATYAGFDAEGRPRGIRMHRALTEDLGLSYDTAPYDVAVEPGSGITTQVLTRIGTTANEPAASKAWVVFTSDAFGDELDTEQDFGDIVLRSGAVYRLAFMQDVDGDGLFAREEYLAGSDDTKVDTDADGIPDFDEVRTGWNVDVRGKTPYLGYADPRRTDSDGDGIPDIDERDLYGTDARLRDTDGDGINDEDEVFGFSYRRAGELSDTPFEDPYAGEVWVTDPLNPDTDGDGLSDGFELTIGSNPQVDDAADFIDTDGDGLSDAQEGSDCGITVNHEPRTSCSSKYEWDTDGDGLPDLLERMIGSDPQRTDSDGDFLSDYQELDIEAFNSIDPTFDVGAFRNRCAAARSCFFDDGDSNRYGSSPMDADSDDEGLSDYQELVIGWRRGTDGEKVFSDPLDADADGDDLDDFEEREHTTDPNDRDTDGDYALNGLTDGEEVAGGLDPLKEDQAITVTLSRIEFGENGDDDLFGGNGDYFWKFSVRKPDGSVVVLAADNDYQVADNSTVTFNSSTSFPKDVASGEFEIFGTIYEDDAGDESCSNSYSQSFGQGVTSQTVSFTNQADNECEFTIYFFVGLN